MGKLITWIALGLFLVVVPLGSWYYLKKGLDYRKQSLSELTSKDTIDKSLDSLGLLSGKTSVVVLDNEQHSTDVVKNLNEQFKNIKGFQIVNKDSVNGQPYLPSGYLASVFEKYQDRSFMLIDTSLQVRNVYLSDIESVKKLVEHIAMVIPRPKESDIKMKQ